MYRNDAQTRENDDEPVSHMPAPIGMADRVSACSDLGSDGLLSLGRRLLFEWRSGGFL